MDRTESSVMVGVILVVAGLLFLVQGFIWTASFWGVFWACIFAVIGFTFTGWFVRDPDHHWWAVIPGFTLLGLATITGIGSLVPFLGNAGWLGTIFLGAIGLSFCVIYLVRPDHWWAVIPGGVLITLALVALLPTWLNGEISGAVFFFGLAATFGLLYVLPNPHGKVGWAWIPAVVMAAMGVIVLLSSGPAVGYVWSLLFILTGVYLLFRHSGRGHMTRHS